MSITVYDEIPSRWPELGKPIKGPQALTSDWRRFWHLTFNIAKTNWKMRFFGSVLGYIWQFIRPLLLFGVLYVFFTKVGHVNDERYAPTKQFPLGQPIPSYHDYGVQLLAAIVLFTYLQEATMNSVRCVVDQEVLVRKIEFPRMVIPLSYVLLATFNVLGNLVVVLVFALATGVTPMASWVELIPILLMEAVFAAGLAMLLSTMFVYFRDIQPIWEVVMQILFYASPVIITMYTVQTKLSGFVLKLYMFNPMAVILEQFKHAFVTHAVEGASYYLGGDKLLLVPVGIVVFVFVLGFYVFNRAAPQVADHL
jgi:ABC-2 type transport system permease protein